MSFSVADAAREAPDAEALVTGDGRRFTWAGLEVAGRRAAGVLERIPPGPVALTAVPAPETVALLLALFERSVPAVPLHPRLAAGERAAQIRASGAVADLGDPTVDPRFSVPGADAAADDLRPDADGAPAVPAAGPSAVRDDGPLAVLFTSGSSGAPRGVELSRRAFLASARASAERLGWEDHDRWLCVLPLAHVGGFSILTRCLLARRTVVLAGRFEPASVVGLLKRERITLASLVPTMVERLLAADPDWRPPETLRAVLLGGAPATADLWRRGLARGLPLLETYGMTETCSQAATAAPGGDPRALRPLDGFDARVRGGRIELRGAAVLTRYLPPGAHDDPFTPDGWLRTGDRGRLRPDGTLEVLGRADAVIVTGGENVAPEEVEAVLAGCPGIGRALVFGVRDPEWGEVVAALLEPEPGEARASDRELVAFCAARLAGFRRPRRIAWIEALPETDTGKVDRQAAARIETRALAARD